MSHYTTLVVVNSAATLEGAIAEAERMLAPFNEDLKVEPYKSYESGLPEDFWAVSSFRDDGLLGDPVTWEKVAAVYNQEYGDDERYEVDELGMYHLSTYNPKSKWDWYLLGGRWTGFWPIKVYAEAIVGKPGTMTGPAAPGTADIARKDDIDFGFKVRDKELDAAARARALTTFAVLDSEGWHEKGSMGWWGMVSNERVQDDWNAAFAQMLDNLAGDAWLAVYDLHI